jgi:hypothetical protein
MGRIVIAVLLAAGATLAMATSGEAQPVPGGNYVGTYEGGGTVQLGVSDDGRWLERFSVTGAHGEGCATWLAQEEFGTRPIPIESDGFSASPFSTLSISGSFTAPNTAQGTFDLGRFWYLRFGPPKTCPRGLVSWTAAGDADAPALVLNAPETQPRRTKAIRVDVSCPGEPCDVTVQGVVSLEAEGSTRRYRLLTAVAGDLQGTATVRLAVPLRARKAIRALGTQGRLAATVKATAVDLFGNTAWSKRTIRLIP